MRVKLEDFKTGWYGVSIGMKGVEVDTLIELLQELKKEESQHFHIASKFDEEQGVADIEFYMDDNEVSNMIITGPAIEPTRGNP